jgi:hypothetical protein
MNETRTPPRAPTASARPPPTTRSIPAFIPATGSLPPPLVDGGRVDTDRDLRIKRALAAAAPLLLLPLRLEYRVVDVATPIRVTPGVSGLFSGDSSVTVRPMAAPRPSAPSLGTVAARPPLTVNEVSLTNRKEIWFRWFPEDDFAERGAAPPSDQEHLALAAFDVTAAGKAWYDANDAAVVSAWQALVRTIAPARALYLLRNRAAVGDPQWTARVGRIALLPARVAIFAIAQVGGTTLLATGSPIADVRYTPEALQDAGWLTNFDLAIGKGMGCRVIEPQKVAVALAADWIVAVGLMNGEAADAFSTLVGDAIANGAFEFLDQDTPTNNNGSTPSNLTDPRSDIPAFLRRATDLEAGALNSPLEHAADLFIEALQAPAAIARAASGAGDAAFEDARAMLYVVGPVLFDSVAQGVVDWRGLDEDRVLDFFAQSICARGVLPAVRFGKNPYGILPVTPVGEIEPSAFDAADEARIDLLLKTFLLAARAALLDPTQVAPPVIAPGDLDAADKLEQILKLNPVSRRLDVADTGSDATRAPRCPYVASAAWQPADYLSSLRETPLRQLPDPDESDPAPPLLYRLARLALEKNIVLPVVGDFVTANGLTLRTMRAPGADAVADQRRNLIAATSITLLAGGATVTGVRPEVVAAIRRMAARLAQGLTQLQAVAAQPDGTARLELLLMEVIDLFQHRIDAWASGLAYRRIVRRRRAGRTGLAGGYYGMLGRLRATSATGGTDGYIQAPSPQQAATAALLRSAYLRHGAGAFAIDLSSARVRRAEFYLDLLLKGLTIAEALGHAGERFLHERHRDDLIFPLRQQFPLRNPGDGASIGVRLFDGLAICDADPVSFPAAARAILTDLKGVLADDLDTLADLTLAEAVHQRAHGHAAPANAWLQVLSGQPVPGNPAVVRTVRSGHASSHRIAWLLNPAPTGSGPRAVAEPALAAITAAALAGFQNCSVAIEIRTAGTAAPVATVPAQLTADLGLEPIDLLLGGESELRLRAINFALRRWSRDAALQQALGPLPHENILSFLARERPIAVRMDLGNPSAAGLIQVAASLRGTVQRARVLEPSDLNAAARPDRPLTDTAEAQLLGAAAATLAARAKALAQRIGSAAASARTSLSQFLVKARNYRTALDAGMPASELELRFAEVETARVSFDDALVTLSYQGEPAVLRPFATGEAALAPEVFAAAFGTMLDRLDAKAGDLNAAAQAAATPTADAAAARRAVAALTSALQGALDGEALPILPVIGKRAETTAEANFNSGSAIADALAEWIPQRARVRNAAAVAGRLTNVLAFSVTEAATTTGDPDGDSRPETEAPRPHFFGTLMADRTWVADAASYAGLVIDEWAEQRPSRSQTTGLAINYDSPQSEAPNCLLLCEPPTGDVTAWDEQRAATMVAETISWMKVRALPAQRRLTPGGSLPQINQVPFKPGAGDGTRRLPTAPLVKFPGALDGVFVAAAPGQPAGLAATGAREISRFSRTEE